MQASSSGNYIAKEALKNSFVQQSLLELISDAAHGTKRFDLIYADLMKIPVPPMDLQIKFQIIYEKLKAERNNFLKQLSNYDKFFKSLQNQAFSGQL